MGYWFPGVCRMNSVGSLKIARWGYPWRLMSGGRHELSVPEPFEEVEDDESQGPFVEVRFASAYDYEVVPEEGDLQHQKMIPGWTWRLHRAMLGSYLIALSGS